MTTINLNTYPYYDDFDPDKNFHRILFKPGFSVQARELTQLQTILQEQIKRFGDNIFKEGSVISGCPESTNFNVDVIKVLDFNTFGIKIELDYLAALEGKTLVGQTNGVRAVVKKVADGTEATLHKAVFLQYISQGTAGTSATFEPDEILELLTDATKTLVVADASVGAVTKGSLFSVGDGIVYVNGNFVRHYTQSIILEKFSQTPNKKVGFQLEESIETSDDDETLLDPAQGAFNYTAPGADRYKLSTLLVSYPINETVEGFFILYEVQDGKISRRYDRTQYAELNKTLARRTYDESGNYVIKPFNYHIREHLKTADNDGVYTIDQDGDAGLIALGIEPGKAYVRGFEYELIATKYVDVEKPVETNSRTGIRLSTAYGNYVIVKEMCGNIPVNGALISLRNAAASAVTAGTYSEAAEPGDEIGTARVATVEYSTGTIGTATATYRVYLYDVKMTGGSFSTVAGLYYENGDKDFHANVSVTPAVLQETTLNNYIIPTNYSFVKTLAPGEVDNSFVYKKVIQAAVSTTGTFSISVSGNENFAFSTLSQTTLSNELIIIAETDITEAPGPSPVIYKAGEIIPVDSTIVDTITSTSISFNLGTATLLSGATVSVLVSVSRSDEPPRTKTLQKDRYIRFQTTKTFDILTKNTVSESYIEFDDVTGEAADFDITEADYGVGDLVYDEDGTYLATVTDHLEADYSINRGARLTLDGPITVAAGKTITIAHPLWDITSNKFTTPPSLGVYDIWGISYVKLNTADTSWEDVAATGTNVTKNYPINNGQTESLYDLGSVSGNFLPESRYVIKFSYFTHNAGAYFSVDSYLLPDQGEVPSNTEIEWYQIPVYTAKNGLRYDLRNCLDFRNTVATTLLPDTTTTLASAPINPIGYTELSKAFAFTPFYLPHPQEEFITDVEWNLPRIDRVILDADGNFTAVKGLAADSPLPPREPSNSMDLGLIFLPPFPALSPKSAREALKFTTETKFSRTELQRRFTMSDIGTIEKRLSNLETFTKLSFMEQKTLNTLIYDDNGEERYKNGVLVDSFEKADRINRENTTNNCLINSGRLTARLDTDTVDLEYASATNIYLKPNEASIVIRQSTSAGNFATGELIQQGTSGASGVLEYAVEIARIGNFKWMRLYLTAVGGPSPFVENSTPPYDVTGLTSASSGKITYLGITENALATAMRPSLVSVPSSGEIATLPYVSVVYSENPYASEAVSVTNNIVYGYEGDIGLIPAEDIWFEHRTLPVVNNYYNTEIIYQEKEIVTTIIVERETQVTTIIYLPAGEGDPPPPPPPPPPASGSVVDEVFEPTTTQAAPPVIILEEPLPVIIGDAILPPDAFAPPAEQPPSYGGGGGSGYRVNAYYDLDYSPNGGYGEWETPYSNSYLQQQTE